ncbi:MAG: serine/threonine-protein kinase, partial [Myxococcota bacterium]
MDSTRTAKRLAQNPAAQTAEAVDPQVGSEPEADGTSHNATAYLHRLDEDEAKRYRIIAEHASGGLGRVLRARDDRLGRTVAIKELLEGSGFATSLFMREALITARLQHPGIVPVHEAGRWPSGEPFYVMKLVSGKSLQEVIRETSTLSQRLGYLSNVTAVVETIAYAHSEDILHRDIKPANIIIGDFGETVVVDWGLARDDKWSVPLPECRDAYGAEKMTGSDSGSAPLPRSGTTAVGPAQSISGSADTVADSSIWQISGNYSVSGRVVGTPAYMAPEQARGSHVDRRADVYSLGALLYELLAGQPPYPGRSLQVVLGRVLAGPPTPLAERDRDIPSDLITIVEKAMARNPRERYATAKELAEDLKRFQTGRLVSAHQYSTWTLIRRWLWKHRSPVVVALVATLMLAVGAALSVDRIIEERNEARLQRAMAQDAREQAEQKRDQLQLKQAESSLVSDPTATVAWLKVVLDAGNPNLSKVRRLLDEALAHGVARHVIEHGDIVLDVAFTADGNQAVSASHDGAIRFVDTATGEVSIWPGPRDQPGASLNRVALSGDGRWLAAGAAGGSVFVWDRTSGTAPRTLDGHKRQIRHLYFTPDDQQLVARAADGMTRVWHVATGELVHTIKRGLVAPDVSRAL